MAAAAKGKAAAQQTGIPIDKKRQAPGVVPALGKQGESQRKTLPAYSISKTGREARDKVFISHEAAVTTSLCTQSPIGGPIYDVPGTMDIKPGRGPAFPKAASTNLYNFGPDDGIGLNDVDTQAHKYARDATVLIGTEPRGRLKDAELIKNHSAAFFGRVSPGPVYGGSGGPNLRPTRPRIGVAMPFGKKLPSKWQELSDLPDKVGPGSHDHERYTAFKNQNLSHRKNQAVNAFPHGPKFAKGIDASDEVSKLDAAKSAFGKQGLSKNRSEPTIGFGRGTRNSRSRTAICITRDDEGPRAHMPKFRVEMPRLPMEVEIMKTGHMA